MNEVDFSAWIILLHTFLHQAVVEAASEIVVLTIDVSVEAFAFGKPDDEQALLGAWEFASCAHNSMPLILASAGIRFCHGARMKQRCFGM